MAKRKKPARFDAGKVIRGVARERVGTVKPSRVIVPKAARKPKHKRDPLADPDT